jgi:hypothetical protein
MSLCGELTVAFAEDAQRLLVKEYTSRVFIGIGKLFLPFGTLAAVLFEILILLAKHGT